jgi:hypothetical protein
MVKEPRLSHWCTQEILPEGITATRQPKSQSFTIHFQIGPLRRRFFWVQSLRCLHGPNLHSIKYTWVKGGQVLLIERECTNLSVALAMPSYLSFFTTSTAIRIRELHDGLNLFRGRVPYKSNPSFTTKCALLVVSSSFA